MNLSIKFLGSLSHVHKRVMRFGIKANKLGETCREVVASSSIIALCQYLRSSATPVKAIFFLLDSSDFVFCKAELANAIKEIVSLPYVDMQIYAVGDLGGLLYEVQQPVRPCLIYDDYETNALILKSLEKRSIRELDFYPSIFYLFTDALRSPLNCWRIFLARKSSCLFLGQAGDHSAEKSFRYFGALDLSVNLKSLLGRFSFNLDFGSRPQFREDFTCLYNFSLQVLADFSKRIGSTDDKIAFFILSRSLMRILQLSALSFDPKYKFIMYPGTFLNVLHWPPFISPAFLDLGGINGLESFYPRSVDLLLRCQKIVKVRSDDSTCFIDFSVHSFASELKQSLYSLGVGSQLINFLFDSI
jgi:hypothetical protein